MSEPTKHITAFDPQGHLTDKGIQAFVAGNLSATDKALADRHLAECDMCTDAVEGISLFSNTDALSKSIAHIHQRIDERVGVKKKIIPMWSRYLSAAAVLLVLFGLVWVTNQYVLNQQSMDLALETPQQEKEVTVLEDSLYEEDLESDPIENDGITNESTVVEEETNSATNQPVNNTEPALAKPTTEQKIKKNTPEVFEQEVADNIDVGATDDGSNKPIVIAELEEEPASIETAPKTTSKRNDANNVLMGETAPADEAVEDVSSTKISADYYAGSIQDTTLAQYVSYFTLSDSIANLGYKGNVVAQIELNKKGTIKTVAILKGIAPVIDKEVIEHLKLTPQSALKARQDSTLIEVTVPIR